MKKIVNLNEIVSNAVLQIDFEKIITEATQEAAKKAIRSAVNNAFSYGSDARKDLEKRIKEQISIDLDKIKLPEYSKILLNAAKGCLNGSVEEEAKKLQKRMNEFLIGEFKTEYKLSEFIHKLKEEHVNDQAWGIHARDYKLSEITLHIENSYSTTYLYFDFQPNISKYACKLKMTIKKDKKLIIREMNGFSFDKLLSLQNLSGLETFIFKAHTRGILIVEEDENNIKRYFDYQDYPIEYDLNCKVPSDIFEDGPDYIEDEY